VHLALDGPPRWAAGDDLAGFAYVHIGPSVQDMARAYADAMAGLLPTEPLLVVGQTTAVDPSRAPRGTHLLWIQVRPLPAAIAGDAAGEISARTWAEAREPFAARVLDKLERYAPGVRGQIRASAVLAPDDLERANPCLVGGDSIGGSHHLDQNGPLRPLAGWSRYRTPIEGLWMVGAATWPGAGVHGISGRAAALSILSEQRGARLLAARARVAGAQVARARAALRR
ncbi:MAG: phytoene desaturase family protein, partial [Solirubrobacteraceae bacterium]